LPIITVCAIKFGGGRLNDNKQLLPPYTHGVGHFSVVLHQCTNHYVKTADQISVKFGGILISYVGLELF